MLQLFPFGWMKENGIPHREEIYSSMISAANCSYTRWNNKRWDHAFLRKCDLHLDGLFWLSGRGQRFVMSG